MKCNYYIEDLVSLIENTMNEEPRIELEHHIQKCSKCNKNYTALKLADILMYKEVNCSKDFYSNLIGHIDENRYKSHGLKYRIGFIFCKTVPKVKLILTAATVLVLLLITVKTFYTFSNSVKKEYNSPISESQNSAMVDGKEDSSNEYDIDKLTEEYITSNLYTPQSGKVFCSYKIIKKTEENNLITQYLMVSAQDYSCIDNVLKKGAAVLVPVSLIIKKIDGIYKVVDFKNPLKYTEGSDELKNLFPSDILEKINNGSYNSNKIVDELEFETINKAKKFYNIQ
jgi:hypothetical protein